MGKLMFHWLPYRKSVILKNIDQVYGDTLTPDEKKHLAMAFYSHLILCIKETLLLRFMSEARLKSSVEVKGHEYLLEIAAQGKGVLILTGHFGSWEVAPIGGILNFEQFKGRFHFIRRTLGSKKIERFLFKRYYQAGLNVIQKQNALQHVTEALAKNDAVVFVLDQMLS